MSEECACRKALEKIRRIPTMPFPDPEAHSWRAFTDAVYRAYGDIQRTVNFALATPAECAGLREELRGIEEALGFCGNPGEAAHVIRKKQQAIEMNRATAVRRGEEITKLRAELAAANERAERAEAEYVELKLSHSVTHMLRLLSERDTAQAGWKEAVEALRRVRQGYMNILEFRQLDSERWGQRDGYGGRYGALTEDEIREAIAPIDPIVARFDAQGGGK